MNFLIEFYCLFETVENRFMVVFYTGSEDEAEQKAQQAGLVIAEAMPYGWGVANVRCLG